MRHIKFKTSELDLRQVVVASFNQNKVQELNRMLRDYRVELCSAQEYVKELPPEDGSSFEENAAIKASYVAKAAKLPALSDDTGLCVEALRGAPGIYSARWAGPHKDYGHAIAKIRQLLQGSLRPKAKFVTVLALAMPGLPQPLFFRGEVRGHLTFPARGSNGFAYDVIFVPEGETRTFAEMSASEKDKYSHRARAVNQFACSCLVKI